MSINWNHLRAWNGDQRSAFEELCCQLAFTEAVPPGSSFFRKGTPDGGVECFWATPSDGEWCWQAKFFLQSLGTPQWKQLTDSFQTAIDRHPNLKRYVVCLPQNLPDGGTSKSSAKKWEEHCAKWQLTAAAAGRSVQIVLWDETQLANRLSKPEHQGTHWFWFDSEQRLTLQWFQERLEEAIANAGDRYTPKVNVELPIAKIFEGLGRSPQFFEQIEQLISSIHDKHRNIKRPNFSDDLRDEFALLDRQFSELSDTLHSFLPTTPGSEFSPTSLRLDDAHNLGSELLTTTEDIRSRIDKQASQIQNSPAKTIRTGFQRSEKGEHLESVSTTLRRFAAVLSQICHFVTTDESRLANVPTLLLTGHAGSGKTHLLCDVATRGLKQRRPHLLLHGSHFRESDPLHQIVHQLGLTCSVDQFLGALTAAAHAFRSRVLIFIDAINEGAGNGMWKKHIAGLLRRLRRHPSIGICLSVRTTYEDLVLPQSMPSESLTKVQHQGFTECEAEAVRRFFTEYEIAPSYPLLLPDFSKPLFLKLFCTAIKNSGLTHVPPGIQGITAVLEFFLDSVNRKLSDPEFLDFNRNDQIVQKAVQSLCIEMASSEQEILERSKAEKCVEGIHPVTGHSRSLFTHLVHEGVLNVDRRRTENGLQEVVQFAYQRFTDHLVSKYMLDTYLDRENPTQPFAQQGEIASLFKAEADAWKRPGLLEALSVQLPERTGKEFFELFPHLAESSTTRRAFVEGFAWRDKNSFTAQTREYINTKILRHSDTRNDFFNSMLMVSAVPGHPYNADQLHTTLLQHQLPDRDAWWSIFLHDCWMENGAVSRLVDWAWSDSANGLSDEVVRLAATTLVWFFTSSNRFLRDRATKALVHLLDNRTLVVSRLLEDFSTVDDPYVTERLYAVTYGVSLRCSDAAAVGGLAEQVYDRVFKNKKTIPVHIRIRDYARGIVERGLALNPALGIDAARICPPYGSSWPRTTPASESSLRSRMSAESPNSANGAIEHLVRSVTSDFEDFRKYIIGDLIEWSNVPLGQLPPSTREERLEDFRDSLTDRQRDALESFLNLRASHIASVIGDTSDGLSHKKWEDLLKDAERKVRNALRRGSRKEQLFDELVLQNNDSRFRDDLRLDADFAAKWILERVVSLGWTAERFDRFDQGVRSPINDGRSPHKAERIGKKYQWIAYCELLGRIADNFQLRWAIDDEEGFQYQGAWQLYHVRDIDPSMLLTSVERDNWRPSSPCWWFPHIPMQWERSSDHRSWLQDEDNLPDPMTFIEVEREEDVASWLNLDGHYVWEEPSLLKEDRYSVPKRQLKYWIRSFLVRKEESNSLFEWLSKVDLYTPLLEDPPSEYRIFLGEFYWSNAYRSQDNEYHGRHGWTKGSLKGMPSEIASTVEVYVRESGTEDCSIDETVLIDLPCKQIVEGMRLSWGGKSSEYVDRSGNVVTFDPSVAERGPAALLIRRNEFLKYLQNDQLEVFWTVSGQKRLVGGSFGREEYLGHMEIGGYYRFVDGKLSGQIHPIFKPPQSRT